MASISVIGQRIKNLRLAKGMTQGELGMILGLRTSAVDEMESSEILTLSSDTIRTLCETFQTFPRFFVFDTDEDFWEGVMHIGRGRDGKYTGAFLKSPIASKVVGEELGADGFEIMRSLSQLNVKGMSRAKTLLADLVKVDDYRRKR